MPEPIEEDPAIFTSLAKSCVLPVPDVLPTSRLASTLGIESTKGKSIPSLLKSMVRFPAVVVAVLPDQVRASIRAAMLLVSAERIAILPGPLRLILPPNERIAPDTVRSPLFEALPVALSTTS